MSRETRLNPQSIAKIESSPQSFISSYAGAFRTMYDIAVATGSKDISQVFSFHEDSDLEDGDYVCEIVFRVREAHPITRSVGLEELDKNSLDTEKDGASGTIAKLENIKNREILSKKSSEYIDTLDEAIDLIKYLDEHHDECHTPAARYELLLDYLKGNPVEPGNCPVIAELIRLKQEKRK